MASDSSPLAEISRVLVENLRVGVYLIQDNRLIYVNSCLAGIFGYSREDMLGLPSALDVIEESDRELVAEKIRQRLSGELEALDYTVRGVRRDGQIVDLDVRSLRTEHQGRPAVMGSMIDVTEQRRAERALRDLLVRDELTGLYNRRGFAMLASGHLALAQRHRRAFSLLFADLDYLKQINDRYGHAAGDRALVTAGDILKHTYRSADVVARLGGDEFAVFPLEASPEDAPRLTARLEQRLEEYNNQGLEPFRISMSVGVGHYHPEDCPTVEDLLAAADAGLYRTKQARPGPTPAGS